MTAGKSATGETGRGGSAYFGADVIHVGPSTAGTGLQLNTQQLTALGAENLVLGALPTDLQKPGSLDVRARSISVDAEA
ncbi:hypothetical protein ABTK54_19830, partial [Acinetobacter baumannii]